MGSPASETKVVFFDIDGTLYSRRAGRIPPRTARAVRALRARGVRVVIATGRHPVELDAAGLEGLKVDGFAAANGQMCLDGGRQLFSGTPLPREGLRAIVSLFERCEEICWLFGERDHYANLVDEVFLRMTKQVSGLEVEVRPYGGETIYQAVVFAGPERDEELARQLPGCSLHRWGDGGVDVVAAGGGKVQGMQAFLERFGATREQCVAFGDEQNDVDMLRFAGVGVAMGNGAPSVKAAADYLTAGVDEDGIALALEDLGLLEPRWDG